MKRRRTGTTAAARAPYKRPRTTAKAGQMVMYKSVPRAPGTLYGKGKEIKAVDIPYQIVSINQPATAIIALLNGVQTGTGFFNRIGSRIEMKSLHIRGVLRNGATAVQSFCRMAIVYDRQPTGALPIWSDIFQARDQTGTATNSTASGVNLDNRDRFVVVRDVQYFLPSVSNAAGVLTNGPSYPGSDQESDINIFIKLKGLVTHFKSSSNPATITDIATGALYFCTADQLNAGAWQWQLGFRLRYDDM